MRELTEQPETLLEMARRHVAEGEARCAQQIEILAQAEADGDSATTVNAARTTLETLQRTLDLMREHLRIEEERAGSGA